MRNKRVYLNEELHESEKEKGRNWEGSHEEDEGEEDEEDVELKKTMGNDQAYSTPSDGDDQEFNNDFAIEQELRMVSHQERAAIKDVHLTAGETAIPIEPFHMDQELAEGHIDRETGDYIVNDNSRINNRKDQWLQDVTEEEIARAQRAQQQRAITNMERSAERSVRSREDLLLHLTTFLEENDTPLLALARRRPPPQKMKKTPLIKTSQSGSGGAALNQQRREEVETITELCALLMDHYGLSNVYEMTRHELLNDN